MFFDVRASLLHACLAAAILSAAAPQAPADAGGAPVDEAALYAPYDALLSRYVHGGVVRYRALSQSPEDAARLSAFVDALEARDPADWPREAAFAYWINLYNAATLELVLAHYPVKSIRDIGGEKDAWSRPVVSVAGKPLTLNQIEHEIVRPRFRDPRVHFALNCASLGCPPLRDRAFRGADLDSALDAVTAAALADPRWLAIGEREVRLTRVFEWFREDFEQDGGSVESFLAPHRAAAAAALAGGGCAIAYLDWDWALNEAGAGK